MPLKAAQENSVLLLPLGGLDESLDVVVLDKGDFSVSKGVFNKFAGSTTRRYGIVVSQHEAAPIWAMHQFFGSVGTIGNIFQPGTFIDFTEYPPTTKIPPYDNPPTVLPTDTGGNTVTPTSPYGPVGPTDLPVFPDPPTDKGGLKPGSPPGTGTDYPTSDFVTGWDRYDGTSTEHIEYIWTTWPIPLPLPPQSSLPPEGIYTHTTAVAIGDHLRDSQYKHSAVQPLSAPSGITVGNQENRSWEGHYTSASFNFTAFGSKHIYLVGTYSYLKYDGTTEIGPCWQDISAYAGTTGTIRVFAPMGDSYRAAVGSGGEQVTATGWVDYPTVRIVPRSNDPYED